MIILRFPKHVTQKELMRVLARLKPLHSDVYMINHDGPDFTDVICDSDAGDDELLKKSGALAIIHPPEAYILASRNYQNTVVDVLPRSNWQRGKGPLIIGGPCSVEDRTQVLEIAHAVREYGADALIIEVDTDPASAKSDGPQTVNIEDFARLVKKAKRVYTLINSVNHTDKL